MTRTIYGKVRGKTIELDEELGVMKARNVVIGWHQAEVHDPIRSRRTSRHGLQQDPDRPFLQQQGRDLVGTHSRIVQSLFDAPGRPAQLVAPKLHISLR
jgi:hypothetical protein